MNVFLIVTLVGASFLGVNAIPVPTNGVSSVTVVHQPPYGYSTVIHHDPFVRLSPIPSHFVHHKFVYPLGFHQTPILLLPAFQIFSTPALPNVTATATTIAPTAELDASAPDSPEVAPQDMGQDPSPDSAVSVPEVPAEAVVEELSQPDPVVVVPAVPPQEVSQEPLPADVIGSAPEVVPQEVGEESSPSDSPLSVKNEDQDLEGLQMAVEMMKNDQEDDTIAVEGLNRSDDEAGDKDATENA